jgi:hypothetical protein
MPAGLPAILAAVAPSILGGLGQIFSSKQKQNQQNFEQQLAKMPKYTESPEISRYYQQALQQANVAPERTASYIQQQQQIARNLATGLGATGYRPGGQSAVAGLVQGATDASMRNLAQAENLREQRIARSGQAAQMKSGEDLRMFQMNKLQPWQTKFNLLAQKAAQAAVQQGSGLSNLASAATNAGRIFAAKYGDTSGLGTGKKKGSSSYPVDEFGELRLDDYGNKIG